MTRSADTLTGLQQALAAGRTTSRELTERALAAATGSSEAAATWAIAVILSSNANKPVATCFSLIDSTMAEPGAAAKRVCCGIATFELGPAIR